MAQLLVIDDNIDVAHLISEMLEREGHKVEISTNGRDAINRLEKGETFDVIITDLIMPDLDGMGVLHYIRDHKADIPVLVLTGGGVTIKPEEALKAASGLASDVLTKPIKYGALLEKVDALSKR